MFGSKRAESPEKPAALMHNRLTLSESLFQCEENGSLCVQQKQHLQNGLSVPHFELRHFASTTRGDLASEVAYGVGLGGFFGSGRGLKR